MRICVLKDYPVQGQNTPLCYGTTYTSGTLIVTSSRLKNGQVQVTDTTFVLTHIDAERRPHYRALNRLPR